MARRFEPPDLSFETEITARTASRDRFATFQTAAPHLGEREFQVAPASDAQIRSALLLEIARDRTMNDIERDALA